MTTTSQKENELIENSLRFNVHFKKQYFVDQLKNDQFDRGFRVFLHRFCSAAADYIVEQMFQKYSCLYASAFEDNTCGVKIISNSNQDNYINNALNAEREINKMYLIIKDIFPLAFNSCCDTEAKIQPVIFIKKIISDNYTNFKLQETLPA